MCSGKFRYWKMLGGCGRESGSVGTESGLRPCSCGSFRRSGLPDAVNHDIGATRDRFADNDRATGAGAARPNNPAGADHRIGVAGFDGHRGAEGEQG